MYQPKVNKTQRYSNDKENHLVCEGKPILLRLKADATFNDNVLWEYKGYNNIDTPWYFLNPTNYPMDMVMDGHIPYYLIIISETEEIEDGDWVYDSFYKDTFRNFGYRDIVEKYHSKILALPEHFSNEHLKMFIGDEMEDGVMVKCEQYDEFDNMVDNNHVSTTDYFKIHLVNNHITLFPTKKDLEEASEEYMGDDVCRSFEKEAFKAGAKWYKDNH